LTENSPPYNLNHNDNQYGYNMKAIDITEIEALEQQRKQATEALEISGNFVKCQRCRRSIKMRDKPFRSISSVGAKLETRIKNVQNYKPGYLREEDKQKLLQELREKLAAVDAEAQKRDWLRAVPLFYIPKLGSYVCYRCSFRSMISTHLYILLIICTL
jgi:hypothetical protein